MLSFLFITDADWVMRTTLPGNNTGIRGTNLEDFDYVNDSQEMTLPYDNMQSKISNLHSNASKIGLQM